jgi:RNA polymerase sigma-70 factor (ECF subfamily)
VVWAAVEALPGRQREVVILRDVQGFGREDVCEILGLTAENQRVLLHRARAKVRAAIEAHYSGEIT